MLTGGEGGLETECPEVIDFFRQAASVVQLTANNLTKLAKLDAHFHFYCLHLLIPTLAELFNHTGRHGNGGILIIGPILKHCGHIFQNLVKMAVSHGPVYVGRYVLMSCDCMCVMERNCIILILLAIIFK